MQFSSRRQVVSSSLITLCACFGQGVTADALTDAIKSGKATADIRIRYEDVGSGDIDSDGMTIRTRLGYTTGSLNGFSAMLELEDTRDLFGIDDERSLIPDNENTEIDQGFVMYKKNDSSFKVGRQVLTLDGHRHVGHVGWRQDRQTFDAARLKFSPLKDLTIDLSYLWKRNRINSGNGGFPDPTGTSDKLINVAYKSPLGKIVAYHYSLSKVLAFDATDTFGLSIAGSIGDEPKFHYAAEYAQQDNKTVDIDTHYNMLELGATVSGITAKLGYELLGSDDGIENFQSPLATVHKFNGWADVFLGGSLFGSIDGGNGLEDTYISVAGEIAGAKILAVYHDYSSDESSSDLGSEINLQAVKKFGKHYSAGIKYADYSAEDTGGNGGKDKDILWLWVGAQY